jgi:putative molybdopterin biosynthesis protein
MSKQEQFLNVIDRDEAERRFHDALRLEPLGSEQVELAAALGRILAADIVSSVDVPSFDRSNVDGFAVRAADTYGATEEETRELHLLTEVIATSVVPTCEVGPGQAATIATGGMLPRGADAVVMVEDTDSASDRVSVRRAVTPGAGVTFAGTDIAAGETVLRVGQQLTSRETGVLAAIGLDRVAVYRRPIVGVLSTGDEIIAPGKTISPGEVYDSNARILADAVCEQGAEAISLGIVRDDAGQLRKTILQALQRCDVLLLSGGTSKGAGDISYRLVRECTDPGIVAHGVALKPGKPICLASHHGKPVVILPGFPTSAVFTFHEFVAPVIRRLGGRAAEAPADVAARLAVRVNSEIGRTEYLLVGLVHAEDEDADTKLSAYPMGKGSGSVTAFSRADGFVTIPRHQEIVAAGATIQVRLLGRDLRVSDLVVIGSHCVGLDYLLGQLQQRGWHTKFLAVGSTAGLDAARRGECDVAGVHLLDAATEEYNRPFLTEGLDLISGYRRMQGILYREDDARFAEQDNEQILERVTTDPGCIMINRNRGSGTRILIDRLLGGEQPPGYALQARNHNAIAAAIVQRRADWGVAIESVARQSHLGFNPLTEEQYDFVVPSSRRERPAVRALQALLVEPDVKQQLARLGCQCMD